MSSPQSLLIQGAKIILGILVSLPLVFFILAISGIWGPVFYVGEEIQYGIWIAYAVILLLFIVLLVRVETIGWGSKGLWFFRFLIAGPVAMPIFWYYFIWRADEYARWDESELADPMIDEIGNSESD